MKKVYSVFGLISGGLMLIGLGTNSGLANENNSVITKIHYDSSATRAVESPSNVSFSQNDIKQETDNKTTINKEEITKRVKQIWFELPPALISYEVCTDNPDFERRVKKVMTKSMGEKFSEGYKAYLQVDSDKPEESIDIAESLFGFWGAQDPDNKGTISSIDFTVTSADMVEINVLFLNYTNPEEHHIVLKKENGEWLLDNFDNFKDIDFKNF